MGCKLFYIEHLETVAREDLFNHEKGQVRKMFVVDRVELTFRNKAKEMGKFERCGSLRLKQYFEARDEIIHIGNVRQHVIGCHKIGTPAVSSHPLCGLGAEKRDFGRNAFTFRYLGDIGGGLNAQDTNAALLKILKEIAVVTGDLNHKRRGIQAVSLRHIADILTAVMQPRLGK